MTRDTAASWAGAVAAQPAGQVGKNNAFVLQLNAEQPAGKLLQNGAGYFNAVLFAHKPPAFGFFVDRPAHERWHRAGPRNALGHRDVGGLQTFRARRYFKFHTRAFIQAAVTLGLKGGEVYKDILSILPLDKAVALGRVKPLHCTFFFHLPIFVLS